MHVVRGNRLEEIPDDDPDVDYELTDATRQFGSHTNSIPLQSAVQAPRLFYGGRFANQALAIEGGEAPLIQNLDTSDPDGRSFDEIVGEKLGAIRARQGGQVVAVKPDLIRVRYDDGKTDDIDLYNDMAFNQKSGVTSRPVVKKGDVFTPGQVVAASSFTDDNGVQNMGLNARIGLVPWKGFSMDDAIPVSESFAKRLSAIQYKVLRQDSTDNLKTGLNHYRALFPTKFTKEKLEQFDADGLVKPGTVLNPGDPVMLATMPRTVSSAGANVGKLSKALMQSRRDASQIWDGNQQATVVAARKTKNGCKVVLKFLKPTEPGDKIVLRQGAKATVSKVIPDDQMPRTEDGQPLDALLNPLSLVSRANPASQHELRLGKVAKKLGKSLKIPSYLPKGQNWNDYIDSLEAEHGVQSKERVYDPETERFLSEPITVGYGFVNKLHHTSENKLSSRGMGGYDQNEQPTRGGGETAGAKRYSGLENYATLSSGAYALMRENSTLRGQANHDFWRALRSDKPLPKVGEPFVWHKFRAILAGAGMNTKETGKGRYRLAPFTDKDLDEVDPIDVENGEMVRLRDLSPVEGGLFDGRLLNGDRWGRVRLPRPIINPAMEDTVRVMLGLTKNQLEDVLAGRLDLSEAMAK
jgi:DNA-directed RNA polymerase subunit beta